MLSAWLRENCDKYMLVVLSQRIWLRENCNQYMLVVLSQRICVLYVDLNNNCWCSVLNMSGLMTLNFLMFGRHAHTWMCVHAFVCACTHIQEHACVHKQTHTCAHTHTHTLQWICNVSSWYMNMFGLMMPENMLQAATPGAMLSDRYQLQYGDPRWGRGSGEPLISSRESKERKSSERHIKSKSLVLVFMKSLGSFTLFSHSHF